MLVNCPNCGEKTALLNNVCEHCGSKVKKCTECGNVVLNDALTCDYCGFKFESEDELKKQKEKEHEFKVRKKADTYITNLSTSFTKSNRIATLFILIMFGLLALTVGICYKFGNIDKLDANEVFERLLNADSTKNKALIALGCALFAFFIVQILSPLWFEKSSKTLLSQMKNDKFDINTYCLACSKDIKNHEKKITEGFLITFLTVIKCDLDAGFKRKRELSNIITAVIILVGEVLIFLGLKANIDAYFAAVILSGRNAFSFDFNFLLIVGLIAQILGIIISNIDARKIGKNLTNWLCDEY